MPGGIGPISGDAERVLSRSDRFTGLDRHASPVQIFYNLGVGRVHYLPQERLLYFVESTNTPILPTIKKACHGLPAQPVAEQLFLDRHGFIKGAFRMSLTPQEANLILVALRLTGTRISMAGQSEKDRTKWDTSQ